jgi:hypothetical protein
LRGSSTLRGLNLLTGQTCWTLDCSDYAVTRLDCQNGDDLVGKRLALSADELYVFFNPNPNWLFKSNIKLAPTLAPAAAPASPTESPTVAPTGLPTDCLSVKQRNSDLGRRFHCMCHWPINVDVDYCHLACHCVRSQMALINSARGNETRK